MAWNRKSKDLSSGVDSKRLPVGLPVSSSSWSGGRPYYDGWDVEKAWQEGSKVTWVTRCVETIAGSQARLPLYITRGGEEQGNRVVSDPLLDVLNNQANVGESGFHFRFRLSAQLLMSSRGVFIEVIRSRSGQVAALNLLPPQYTAPIPDPKTFVAGYGVRMPTGQVFTLPPRDVLWLRRPHPLDPYKSWTPMESIGLAIEVDVLQRLYNRNFLLNDGRPGGILVIKDFVDDDVQEELKARFNTRGVGRAGETTVLSAENGADYVDMGSRPRDAAYVEMRSINKEDILLAFGVPESVLGNASGRTFSNAKEERALFWEDTMLPHLELVSGGLSTLDEDDNVDFDLSSVTPLVEARLIRMEGFLRQFNAGLITANEFRREDGREEVVSDLADSMLANPNLTPIGNPKKAMEFPEPGLPVPRSPEGGAPELAAQPTEGFDVGPSPAEPFPVGVASASSQGLGVKSAEAEGDGGAAERWEQVNEAFLSRFADRQSEQLEKLASDPKVLAALAAGTLAAKPLWDRTAYDKRLAETLRPVLLSALADAASSAATSAGMLSLLNGRPVPELTEEKLSVVADELIAGAVRVNVTTEASVVAAVTAALSAPVSTRGVLLAAGLSAAATAAAGRLSRLAGDLAFAAANAAVVLVAAGAGVSMRKQWVTQRDEQVRASHRKLDGEAIALGDSWEAEEGRLRWPGDPSAPAGLVVNCRCRVRIVP